MWPVRRCPNHGIDLYLLAASAESSARDPSSYSTTFMPLSQCSPCEPTNTMAEWFHSPMGFSCFCSLGVIRSYSAPERWVGNFPSEWRSSSIIWYSKPIAECDAPDVPVEGRSTFDGCPPESSSETLYFKPLFPAADIFQSHASSKSPNVATVMRSPPGGRRPSGPVGTFAVATFLIAPSSTTQCPAGIPG